MSQVTVVMYHYVRDLGRSRYPSIKGLNATLFKRQLEYLAARYTFIRVEELISALNSGTIPDNAVLLTFDDGYIDHYTTVFPILENYGGVQGCFFPSSAVLEGNVLLDVNKIHFILASANTGDIYSALISELNFYRGSEFDIPDVDVLVHYYAKSNRFDSSEVVFIKLMLQTILPERLRAIIVDKLYSNLVGVNESVLAKELYCDKNQLATMKKHGMFIGLHGHNHGWLGEMAKEDYEKDINHSICYMDSIGLIDKKAWIMSYPYGSHNNEVVNYIRANGCVAGFTTEVAVVDFKYKHNRFLLPRLDTNDFPPISENYKAIASNVQHL